MSNDDFSKYCQSLNELCKNGQGRREVVADEGAGRALLYSRQMSPNSAQDVLLLCVSLNLLNAYVKQGNHKKTFGYYFKRYAGRLVERLEKSPIDGVEVCAQ